MIPLSKLYADFNNADKEGRVRLNTLGTLSDLKLKGIELKEGLELLLDDDDGLMTPGIVQFSSSENIWVAKIDWNKLQ